MEKREMGLRAHAWESEGRRGSGEEMIDVRLRKGRVSDSGGRRVDSGGGEP